MVFRRRDVKCLCFPAWPIGYILKRNGKKWEIPTLPCSCWKSPRNLRYWVGAGLCWSSLRHFLKPAFLKREILNAILPADNPPSLSPHLWQHLPCGGGRTLKLLVHCSVSPSTGAGWAGIGLRVRSPGSTGVAADTASPGQRSPARAGVQVGRCICTCIWCAVGHTRCSAAVVFHISFLGVTRNATKASACWGDCS